MKAIKLAVAGDGVGASLEFAEETDSASGQDDGPGVEAHFEDASAWCVEGLRAAYSGEAEFEHKSDDLSLHVMMYLVPVAGH